MDAFGITETGLARPLNEDHFVIADMVRSVVVERTTVPAHQLPPRSEARRRLLLVADGFGRQCHGELASRLVADALLGYLADAIPIGTPLPLVSCAVVEREIRAGMEQCQALVDRVAEADDRLGQIGTAVTLAYLLESHMVIGHVGDSRCYLLRNGKLQQLTRDHPVAREEIDAGPPNGGGPERSRDRVGRGLLGATPEVFTVDVRPADVVLLCTDGLTEHLSDETVRDILDVGWPPDQACRWLVEAACRAGAQDDITCVVGRFTAPDRSPSDGPPRADAQQHPDSTG